MAWLHTSARRIFCAGSAATLMSLLLLLFLAAGCSGVLDPITPNDSNPVPEISTQTVESGGQRSLWGFYRMSVNEDHTEIDVEPLRSTQLHLNVVSTIESINPALILIGNMVINPDDSVTVEVSLTHPLEGFPEYTGFDVRGIMLLPAEYTWPEHNDLTTPGMFTGQSALLNADGYTRRWNPTEFFEGEKPFSYYDGKLIPAGMGALCTSLVNPYKAFWWNTNRRYLEPGDMLTRHYIISFPPGPNVFAYAIDASWDAHTIDVAYQTSFDEDDKNKAKWDQKELGTGSPTDFWKCDWFTGSVNVRDDACSAYMGEGEGAVLFSKEFYISADISNVELKIKHALAFDDDNEYDGAAIFLTPNFNLNPSIQLYSSTHAYDYLEDPQNGWDWWTKDHNEIGWDVFNLTPALTELKTLGEEKFRIIFVFINAYDDIGITEEGWTITDLEIWNYNAPPTSIPDSFPGSANSMEPYEIKLVGMDGQLECSLEKYAGGSINMQIEVSDWQAGASVNFNKIKVEAPDLFDGTVSPWTGSGTVSTYTYEIIIPNDKMVTPGEVPVLFSLISGDDDEYWLPEDPLAAYMMFTLEVNEISPPFCLSENAIHTDYAGTFQILGSSVNQHLDCSFMPVIAGGSGALLFDGGIDANTEYIQYAPIPGNGGTTDANTLTTFTGPDSGNAIVLEANEFNGHILFATTDDPDNIYVYNSAGDELMDSFDLGNGDDGINEPVVFETNPANGDIWLVGHHGSEGIFLEHWAYVSDDTSFDYIKDPASQIDLSEILGSLPKPLGIAFNADYDYLCLFHARFFGSLEVYEIGASGPPVHNDEYSLSNIFPESISTTEVDGLRKLIGGDIVVDHVDGDEEATCRVLLFANTISGGSWLIKMDTWGHVLGSAPLGSPYSCMAINNLPSVADRSVVLFPITQGIAYSLFSAPAEW